ncbi:MAG: tRNA threonylcarbamoyladenosine biosynthesis protein RimN [SAR86 cluster bacterium]|uniref:Threonylcarbamoyl-AMP synthase n=1 Tax=SAR86 cluster bacterium TaxID=2030880 RepID=A0A2A5B806_9GAMM|nr:MAG: tRNA threonylcarbamoyladenosine biosynthesis protein RimN [SAR86 cluster bacterium]
MNELKLHLACDYLKQGKVIAYPTEAVWGLGCDPDNRAAVMRILRLKDREVEKGLILVAANMGQLAPLLQELNQNQLDKLQNSWPGPITWVIPDPKELIPAWIKGDHKSVAVRVSAHPVIRQLCLEFNGPIVSTSANKAGQPEIISRSILEEQFASSIDYIVAGELGGQSQVSEIRDIASGKVFRQ